MYKLQTQYIAEFFLRSNPLYQAKSPCFFQDFERISTNKIYSDGDKGSPCLNPLHFIHLLDTPFNNTDTEVEDSISQIHPTHLSGNPFACNTPIMNSQFKLSNAFSKSNLQRNLFSLDHLQKANISCALKKHSIKLQSRIKADYAVSTNSRRKFDSLKDKIFAMILYKLFNRLIGLKSLIVISLTFLQNENNISII